MTLEQVMALDGRELLEKIAPLLGYKVLAPRECLNGLWDNGTTYCYESNGKWFRWTATDERSDGWTEWNFDWSAAMQIRDWARGLDAYVRDQFVNALTRVVYARLEREQQHALEWVFLDINPVDLARAALLVSP